MPGSSVVNGIIIGLADSKPNGGGTENLGLITTADLGTLKSEALALLSGDVQTAQKNLEQVVLGGFDSVPNPSSQEGLALVTGANRPNPASTASLSLAASGTHPGSTAGEAVSDCAYISVNQNVPVIQNCNGAGSGSTTVNAGTHPWGVTYDAANGYVYVTDYKSGTVSVLSNLAIVGR